MTAIARRAAYSGPLTIAAGALLAACVGIASVKYGPSTTVVPMVAVVAGAAYLRRPQLALAAGAGIVVAVPYWMKVGPTSQLNIPRAALLISFLALLATPRPRFRPVVIDLIFAALAIEIAVDWYAHLSNGVHRSSVIDGLVPLVFYPIARRAGSLRNARLVSWAMLFTASIGALTVLYEYFVSHSHLFNFAGRSWAEEPGVYLFRPGGSFGSPPGAAIILSMVILTSLPLLRGETWHRHLARGLVLVCLLGDIVTFTRAGWFGLVVGGIVYLFATKGFARGTVRLAAAVLAVVIVAAIVYPQAKHSQTFQLGVQRPGTFQDRSSEWGQSLPIAYDSPGHLIFGRGYGVISYGTRLDPALASTQLPSRSAHNDYLRALVEQGLLGVLLFAALFAGTVARALRYARTQGPETCAMASAFGAATACYAVGAVGGDVFLFPPAVALMALSAGMCATLTTQDPAAADAAAGSQQGTTS